MTRRTQLLAVWTLALLTLAAAASRGKDPAPDAPASKVLFDFKDGKAEGFSGQDGVTLQVEDLPAAAGSAKKALKVTCPARPGQYPLIQLTNQLGNWRDYDYVEFDCYSAGDKPINLSVEFADVLSVNYATRSSSRGGTVKPGKSTVRVNLSDLIRNDHEDKPLRQVPADGRIDRTAITIIKIFLNGMGQEYSFYLDAVRLGQHPACEVKRLKKPPKIDGTLDDSWKEAGQVEKFENAGAGTRAYLGCDDENLYLAIVCEEPQMQSLVAKQDKHDGEDMWQDDSVEIFLDVNRDRIDYYHFCINALGTVSDQKCAQGGRIGPGLEDKSWNPKTEVKVGKQEKSWTVEMKLPLAELELGLDSAPVWCFNICRCRPQAQGRNAAEYSGVRAKKDVGFHAPWMFANLKVPLDWLQIAQRDFASKSDLVQNECALAQKEVEPALKACPQAAAVLARSKDLQTQLAKLKEKIEILRAEPDKRSEVAADFQALVAAAETARKDRFKVKYTEKMSQATGVENPKFAVAIVDSATKVFQHLDLTPFVASQSRLAFARHDYEGLQVVVIPLWEELKDVQVSVGDLAGPGGAKLAAANFSVHPVGYVRTKGSPFPAKFLGWTPDILLADNVFQVKDHYQPVWINFYAPSNAAKGNYEGVITVKTRGASEKVKVAVEVYDVTLPLHGAFRSAFGTPYDIFPGYHAGGNADNIIRAYLDVILKHRICPLALYSGAAPYPPREYLPFCMERGMNTIMLGCLGQQPGGGHRAYYDYLKSMGWEKDAIWYVCDEPGPGMYPAIKNTAAKVRQMFPEVPIAGAVNPDPQLFGAVNLWIPVLGDFGHIYKKEECDARKTAGDQCWLYVCCDPLPPWPNLLVDNDGIDPRILPWIIWREKLGGLLYYYVNQWDSNPAKSMGKLTIEEGPFFPKWNTHSFRDNNGDGMILYPGPAASLRLENLRDGIEDYEYFALLRRLLDEKKGKLDKATIQQAEECLQIEPSIIKTCDSKGCEFTKKLGDLREKREKVARMIERLQAAPDMNALIHDLPRRH